MSAGTPGVNHLPQAADLLAALAVGDARRLSALLDDAPTYRQLGVHLTGRQDVLDRLLHGDAANVYRQVAWSAPEAKGETVQALGRLPDGGPRAGIVLTLSYRGDRVAELQQQNLPPRPVAGTKLRLTPKIRELIDGALVSRHPMLLAYTDHSGQPVLSYRGSTQAFSEEQLAMWVRNPEGHFVAALRQNPKVALMYRDEDSKATFQFQGRARIATDEEDRRRVYAAAATAERHHDFARLGVAVLVDLDRVEGYEGLGPGGQIGRVLMLRDTALSG